MPTLKPRHGKNDRSNMLPYIPAGATRILLIGPFRDMRFSQFAVVARPRRH